MADQPTQLPDITEPLIEKLTKEGSDLDSLISLGTNQLSGKQMAIAAIGLLVCAVIFFFIKRFVAGSLVANSKKSPRAAEMAAWSLFGILMLGAVAAMLAMLDSTKFLSWPYLVPISVGIVALLATFVMGLRSNR